MSNKHQKHGLAAPLKVALHSDKRLELRVIIHTKEGSKMAFVKGLLRAVIGVVFGICAALALSPAFAAFASDGDTTGPLIMIGFIVLSGALGVFAPTIRRAFGRGFLLLGASVFALPISTFLLSGRAANDVVNAAEEGTEAAAVVGAGLAGVAVTGVATFVGLIVGAILLLIGLVLTLGGRREVVVVNAPAHK